MKNNYYNKNMIHKKNYMKNNYYNKNMIHKKKYMN